MRILLECGTYVLCNMGDVAMLQVAIKRLEELWPDASITVITAAPDRLQAHCPDVQALLLELQEGRRLAILEDRRRRGVAASAIRWIGRRRDLQAREARAMAPLLDAIDRSNLVIAAGGGYLTDAFAGFAHDVLTTLQAAIEANKPTALLGQGVGPVTNPELGRHLGHVLRSVDLIGLREGRVGPSLLEAMGVPMQNVVITGDDAVEMAYRQRPGEMGSGIGVGVRLSYYSDMDHSWVGDLYGLLEHLSTKLDAPLLPIPISLCPEESDCDSLAKVVGPMADDFSLSRTTPLQVISQVGRCRIVVTGSYHAGVFALSQGIPVVGMARSRYYADKLCGLADQFGVGCEVVLLDQGDLQARLTHAIEEAWQSAEELRPRLLAAAERQIELGREAYRKLKTILDR